MLEESKTTLKKKLSVSLVQKYLLFGLVFLLPLAIMPFPWDWTERSMSLLILSSSTIIVGLEVVKLIWDGKVSILKSTLDLGFFTLLLSMLLSTVFSKDINSSLWGIDARLGGGIIVFISIILVSISARTFLKEEKDIQYVIMAFLGGFFINNVLSILSFLGVNIWGLIPIYRDLHQNGLPLLRSANVHLVLNFLNILFCMNLVGGYFLNKKQQTKYILAIIFGSVSIINIWVYSISQGLGIVVFSSVILILFALFVFKKMKLQVEISKSIFLFYIITILAIIIPSVLLQITAIKDAIIPESLDLVAQISLGTDVSWIISASVFVDSFVRGLLGMGADTYPIAYYLFKPLNVNLLPFNGVTFYHAGSEVFTQFTNGGLVWLISWIFLGFLIVKTFVKDLANIKLYGDQVNSFTLLILNLSILLIFVSSFFISFSVLVVFLLFMLASLRAIMKEILAKTPGDRFVMKLWAVNLDTVSQNSNSAYNLNIFLTVVISAIFLGGLGLWISKTVSSVYALKAESYFVEQNAKYVDAAYPTIQEREAFVTSMTYYYSRAVDFDKGNPLYNRRQGLMYLERVGIAAEKYSKMSDVDEDRTEMLRNVGIWRNYVIDSTRKSIDISPYVYPNWEARSKIYMGLVGMGFNDYSPDSMFSLEKALELNPLNFELHYSMAQMYVIKGEKDSALASLTKVLSINPQHIPSILLAGDLNKDRGNMDVYESYLKAAKKILEIQGNTNLEIYSEVTKQLNSLEVKTEPDATQEAQTEETVVEEESDSEVLSE